MMVVIIPAYKPDQTLGIIVERLWTYGYQAIVVDDGSGAEYQQEFSCIKEICVVLTHPANRGKGAAVKTALHYIQEEIWDCDAVGIMDADGQHLVEDLEKVLQCSETHKNALVLGVRDVGREMPLKSRLGNAVTRTVFRAVSGVEVSDTQTGLRAFDPALVPELLKTEGDRYEYEINVLLSFARKGIPIIEIPIHTVYRDKENSTSHFRVFWDSVRIYRNIFKFTLFSLRESILFVISWLLQDGIIFRNRGKCRLRGEV